MKQRAEGPGLAPFIAGVVLVGVAVLGVVKVSSWFNTRVADPAVQERIRKDLDRAAVLVEAGSYDEARTLLQPITENVRDEHLAGEALLITAEAALLDDDTDTAGQALKRILDEFPESRVRDRAALEYASVMRRTGDHAESEAMYQELSAHPNGDISSEALLGLAFHEEQSGNLAQARAMYLKALDAASWRERSWYESANRLGSLKVRSLFSPEPTAESTQYAVQPGDTLTTIGMKLNTTQAQLLRANRLDNANRLQVNQVLKYTPKRFEIVIDLSTLRLYVLDQQGLFKVYRVGLGKPGQETPPGRYRIGNKEVNPTWFKPGVGAIPPGDPANELGSRWLPLIPDEPGLPTDLGIHGTIDPDSIGIYSSSGCPRMHNEDVEELYDLMVRSTPVRIVSEWVPPSSV